MKKEVTNIIVILVVVAILVLVPRVSVIESVKNVKEYYTGRNEATASMNQIKDLKYDLDSQLDNYIQQSSVKTSEEIIGFLEGMPGVKVEYIDTVNFRNGQYQEVQKGVTKDSLAPHEGLLVKLQATEVQPVLDAIEEAGIVCSMVDTIVPKKIIFLVINVGGAK